MKQGHTNRKCNEEEEGETEKRRNCLRIGQMAEAVGHEHLNIAADSLSHTHTHTAVSNTILLKCLEKIALQGLL